LSPGSSLGSVLFFDRNRFGHDAPCMVCCGKSRPVVPKRRVGALTMRATGLGSGIDKDRGGTTPYSAASGILAASTRPMAVPITTLVLVDDRHRPLTQRGSSRLVDSARPNKRTARGSGAKLVRPSMGPTAGPRGPKASVASPPNAADTSSVARREGDARMKKPRRSGAKFLAGCRNASNGNPPTPYHIGCTAFGRLAPVDKMMPRGSHSNPGSRRAVGAAPPPATAAPRHHNV
jgi:hypothetical protein